LRGNPGTHVTLRVHRPGISQRMTFSLVREKIHNRSVQPGVLLADSVGYVRLTVITPTSLCSLVNSTMGTARMERQSSSPSVGRVT